MNFFSRFKKVFLIIGFLIIVVVIGYFIWRVFFRSTPFLVDQTPSSQVVEPGELPIAGPGSGIIIDGESGGKLPGDNQSGGGLSERPSGQGEIFNPNPVAIGGLTEVVTLNETPTLSLTINDNNQVQFYDKNDGKFYRLNSDGTKTALSDRVFHSIKDVTWSQTSDKAVIEYPDGNKIVYDFNENRQVTLPSHWQGFSFSTDGEKLVSKSIGYNTKDSWLIVSNSDGSQVNAIEKIGDNYEKVYPAWSPSNQIAALFVDGVNFNQQEIFFVGLNDENFKSTLIEGRGFQSKWSPSGDRLLYSVYHSNDDYNPRLWVVDANVNAIGQNRRQLTLQTWAEKCTFASATEVYCAVPEDLPRGAGLVPQLADQTKDLLYKIDLTTGSQKLIAIPDGYFSVSQIAVPEDQDFLYFTDKFSGQIYQIKLPN